MKILISGGTGLIGNPLTDTLIQSGHQIFCLTRSLKDRHNKPGLTYLEWNGKQARDWENKIGTVDAIINLAGENLGSGRWTADLKYRLLQSRLDAGFVLSKFAVEMAAKPGIFIQSSAIGIYGTDLTENKDESSSLGSDYLAGLAKAWEQSSAVVEQAGIPRAIIRTGIVLDQSRGALKQILLPFRLFAGGPLGSGKQWMSWIHLKDEVGAIQHILNHRLSGVFNLVAPQPVTNAEMGKAIASVLKRPYWMPVPAPALQIALGEMSTLVLDGQKVLPSRLLESGYEFTFPEIKAALRDVLGHSYNHKG